ncbi:hypothetical protein FB451DRAFT_1194458 [Mycena latifolia]|nr:hypothetical protein FB451DRAFT_1194458 [Mycena latifolia]
MRVGERLNRPSDISRSFKSSGDCEPQRVFVQLGGEEPPKSGRSCGSYEAPRSTGPRKRTKETGIELRKMGVANWYEVDLGRSPPRVRKPITAFRGPVGTACGRLLTSVDVCRADSTDPADVRSAQLCWLELSPPPTSVCVGSTKPAELCPLLTTPQTTEVGTSPAPQAATRLPWRRLTYVQI